MQKISNFNVALKKAMSMRKDDDTLKSTEEIYQDINKAFEILDSIELNDEDYAMYAKPLRDLKNSFDCAIEESREEARKEFKNKIH